MTFLLVALPATVLLSTLVSTMRPMTKLLLSVPLSLMFALVLVVVAEPTYLSGTHWFDRSPWWQVILFVTMVAGMICRYLASLIEDYRKRRAGGRRPKGLGFDKYECLLPLLVSVMVFGLVQSYIPSQGVTWTNIVISFQTGFFWHAVVGSMAPSPAARGSTGLGDTAMPMVQAKSVPPATDPADSSHT